MLPGIGIDGDEIVSISAVIPPVCSEGIAVFSFHGVGVFCVVVFARRFVFAYAGHEGAYAGRTGAINRPRTAAAEALGCCLLR